MGVSGEAPDAGRPSNGHTKRFILLVSLCRIAIITVAAAAIK